MESILPDVSFDKDELSYLQNLLESAEERIPAVEKKSKSLINKLRRLVDADELAFIKKLMENEKGRYSDDETRTEILLDKLSRLNPAMQTVSYENDLDPLLKATGIAKRPGPKERLDSTHYSIISKSIRVGTLISFQYKGWRGVSKKYTVCPLGILYGDRAYLIANVDGAGTGKIWTFRLNQIDELIQSNEFFDPDEIDFDLSSYAAQSFGIFISDMVWDVVWEFDQSVVEEVREYQFHEMQVLEDQENGKVRVAFRACSLVEMCYELFKWGRRVTIVSPPELQEMYDAMRAHKYDRKDENPWENWSPN